MAKNRAARRQEKRLKKYQGKEEGLKRSVSYFDAKFGISTGKGRNKLETEWLLKKLMR